MDYSEGVLHIVYAAHGSEADFLRIETDLQLILLGWAADHDVEMVRGETSLEAWLTLTGWQTHSRRTDAAAARGTAAMMWEEHRNEWEALARAVRLRDVDVNAQITRILNVERRGHDVLYVVGVLHAVNEDLLVANCNAVVHRRRFAEMVSERFAKALMNGTFDHQPVESREDLQALVFLHDRLLTIARPARMDELDLLLTRSFKPQRHGRSRCGR